MSKSKKRTYRRRNTFKRKAKRSKRAGMNEPLGFFADCSSAKNSMIGVKELEKCIMHKKGMEERINDVKEQVSMLKKYLDNNRDKSIKEMPSDEVIELLNGKELYDQHESSPAREAQRLYDLLEDEYEQQDHMLNKYQYGLMRIKRHLNWLKSYHKHANAYEKHIGVYKPDAPVGKDTSAALLARRNRTLKLTKYKRPNRRRKSKRSV